ncbi:zinc finger protein 830-like [Topomyia yanbarensis]|uniref:zinc finger protein 830-like n=1 Tax=Topomyia yanbarensis TaxID=2498891 RepID=UPI00273B658E|nr:zinc finger protein 830-like [Topomyia yanbarensis]XP_058839957.1 zinc finger protein 830-like [Topomyia yanbarensis]
MSAAFRLAKKKYTQQDLRRIMNETKAGSGKQTDTTTKKIDSPLAKYNEAGQLTCVLCRSIVRSEAVWKVHINSKQHKENIEEAKKLKNKTAQSASAAAQLKSQPTPGSTPPPPGAFKRPSSPSVSQINANSSKKLKGILKHSTNEPKHPDAGVLPEDFFESGAPIRKDLVNIRLPSGSRLKEETKETEAVPVEPPLEDEKIPEGFFDDPKADAKARNIEYKDPNDEEWDRFQKEIKEATTESMAIISEEQEESTVERQISEIDEQIRNWSRVLSLEKKKDEVRHRTATALEAGERMVNVKKEKRERDSEDEDDDGDFDEFPDWRAKKSFK